MREPTSQDVKDLWLYMTSHYGTTTINKTTSSEAQAIAKLLDLLGITDEASFKTKFVTTIGTKIYLPFEIGDENDPNGWTLWSQVEICAHEHQHVVQANTMGLVQFAEYYLLSKAGRSICEAEAYTVSVGMFAWHYGVMPDLDVYAEYMDSYGVDAADINYVDKHLRLASPALLQGAMPPEAGIVAQRWLSAHIPDLKA